ncbi:MAG TPA: hypothetical protein VH375_04840 [Rhodanobacteraceae bacterium]
MAFALAAVAPSAFATEWRVGGESDCAAHTIQDAVDLAAQSGDDDKVITLTTDLDYSGQAVQIQNLDVTIQGGPLHCSSAFHGDPPVISGSTGSVFDISGTSHVTFFGLEITEGNAFTGGGINFAGNGTLVLDHVTVDFNSATWGGGINAAASGGPIDIYLNTETQILRNTADTGGGGIELSGQIFLYALQPQTLIAFNSAPGGTGGGIDTSGQVTVTLGSAGLSGIPLIYFNSAQWGGGISISGDGDVNHPGLLYLFTMDPENPVSVSDNFAFVAGGGIYLKTLTNSNVPTAWMCAQDFRINQNVAPEGAAMYLGWDTIAFTLDIGSVVQLNPEDSCDFESLGAVRCDAGVPCNEMSGNVTQTSNGDPTNGAVAVIGTTSELIADRTVMQTNIAESLIKTIGNNDGGILTLRLSNCLTGENQFSREMIHLQNDDNLIQIDQCTFAPDIINSTHVIKFDNSGGNSLSLTNSIVDEPGTLTLSTPDTIDLTVHYVLTNDASTLPNDGTVVVGEPEYVDGANFDYHLLPASPGVDFAPAAGGVDLDGRPRDIDLVVKPNLFGPRDLGAYEVQDICYHVDTVYCDGFDGS